MRRGANSKAYSKTSDILLPGIVVNNLYSIAHQEFDSELNLTLVPCLVHVVTVQRLEDFGSIKTNHCNLVK